MRNLFLGILFSFNIANALIIPPSNNVGQSVVPDDKTYYIHKQGNVDIIYTKDTLDDAKHTAKLEPSLHESYEDLYDWSLDEKLSVGLISDCNQIANGFSTQYPNNRQINYIGGTQYVDYFTSASWLDTLLYHESAHNYQVNVKANPISQGIHKILGNGFINIPTFTIPNLSENSFMLEGNAVLNESWHGNGGRLYNGYLYAQTLLQAKADKIKPQEVYNSKLEFPYADIYYIQGGFYNLYMAQKYGIKAINSYFKHHSYNFEFPFYTNYSMLKATGIDFETSLSEFSDNYKVVANSLVKADGEHIASSQFFYQLNSDEDEIFFLINESGVRAGDLVRFNKKDKTIKKEKKSFAASKLIKVDSKFYTQNSEYIDNSKIVQGLFDENKFIKEGSESKMIQGYLSDGREVYFNVALSFREPKLFVDGKFYAKVNSSVLIDEDDNLYYFVQKNKKRTLFKNKTPIMSLNSYYGIVSDVDSSGGIYFITNSKYGSSLFMYKNGYVSRVSAADNIVEAKLINDKEVLIAAVGENDYYYLSTDLKNIDQTPYELKLFFEDKEYFETIKEKNIDTLPEAKIEYNSFLDMRYSGIDVNFVNSENGTIGYADLKFTDPLTQNSLNIFLSKDENKVLVGGLGYQSALNSINYGIYSYSVVDNAYVDEISGKSIDVREAGFAGFLEYPYYKKGYYDGVLKSSYYQDYILNSREPLSISTSFSRYEQYGKSLYPNYKNTIELYFVNDRDDYISGAKYNYIHDLENEFYLSLDAKYSQLLSSLPQDAYIDRRGVKLSVLSWSTDLDPSIIDMKSVSDSFYLDSAGYVDVGMKKVINLSSYWFTFPISLQREAINLNYKYFNLKSFSNNIYEVDELRAGVTAYVVLMNKLVVPLHLEYIYNDSILAKDKQQLFFSLGISF